MPRSLKMGLADGADSSVLAVDGIFVPDYLKNVTKRATVTDAPRWPRRAKRPASSISRVMVP